MSLVCKGAYEQGNDNFENDTIFHDANTDIDDKPSEKIQEFAECNVIVCLIPCFR